MEPTPETEPEPAAVPTADEQGVDVASQPAPPVDPTPEVQPEAPAVEPDPEPSLVQSVEEEFRAALARWIDAGTHDHVEQRVRELGRRFLGLDE